MAAQAQPSSAQHWRGLEHMYHVAPVNKYFEPELRVGDGTARLKMPVKPSSFHGGGSLHGSVYFKVLDDAAIFAVYSVEREVFVVTSSFTTYLLAPVTEGTLEATGTLVSSVGRMYVAHSVLRCAGRDVGHGDGLFSKSRMPLASLPAYAEVALPS